jgi:hypothetical protein
MICSNVTDATAIILYVIPFYLCVHRDTEEIPDTSISRKDVL